MKKILFFLSKLLIAIILYSDDILLLAPSVDSLQKLLRIVELELFELDMSLNTKKSVCIRFGPRYQSPCCSLKSIKNDDIFGWPHAAILVCG